MSFYLFIRPFSRLHLWTRNYIIWKSFGEEIVFAMWERSWEKPPFNSSRPFSRLVCSSRWPDGPRWFFFNLTIIVAIVINTVITFFTPEDHHSAKGEIGGSVCWNDPKLWPRLVNQTKVITAGGESVQERKEKESIKGRRGEKRSICVSWSFFQGEISLSNPLWWL